LALKILPTNWSRFSVWEFLTGLGIFYSNEGWVPAHELSHYDPERVRWCHQTSLRAPFTFTNILCTALSVISWPLEKWAAIT